MLIKTLYCIFFITINVLLYLKLQKSIQPPRAYLVYGFLIIVVIAHFIPNNTLMPTQNFIDVAFFSIGIVVLHFATNIMVAIAKKQTMHLDEKSQKLNTSVLKVFDFMRQKLFYFMVTLTQIDMIYNEFFR